MAATIESNVNRYVGLVLKIAVAILCLAAVCWLAIRMISNAVDDAVPDLSVPTVELGLPEGITDFERVEEPLFVDPADVLEGEVELLDDKLGSRRQLIVFRAEKVYRGGGGGSEAVVLTNGVWAYSTYVPGPINVVVEPNGAGHDVLVTLPAPQWSGSPEVISVPSDDHSYISTRREFGRLFGDETDTQPAREELQQYVAGRVDQDQMLFDTGSCSVGASVERLLDNTLDGVGLRAVPKHFDGPLLAGQYRVLVSLEQYRIPGSYDVQLPLTAERCGELLDAARIGPEGTASLPTELVEDDVFLVQ